MPADWIFLYGPPGSGKSTNGRRLAHTLDLPFVDLDEEVEKTSGKSISEIFATQGEAAFRHLERQALVHLLAGYPSVMALGGGSLLDETSRALVEACGPVVCLSASLPRLLQRLSSSANQRPLLAGDLGLNLPGLLEKRADHYASFSIQVAEDGIRSKELIWQIQARLGRFRLTSMGEAYDVLLEDNLVDRLGEALKQRGLNAPLVLVSDDNVAHLHSQKVLQSLAAVGMEAHLITFPAGEQHKLLSTVQSVWKHFLLAGLGRRGTVIALGGGVTTDLAGFAAATFMRGVAWVAIPTSLLGMVDASLGGKTGVDLPEGKNLVGAFHPPRLVLSDPLVLATLPEREIRSGMAEVAKAGIIADRRLFELCSVGLESMSGGWMEVISRAMAVKIRLVQEDPYELGRRAALNLGHTIGHALECISQYTLTHGEAVSIGLVAEARLAEGIGLAQVGLGDKISAVLTGLGLPVDIPPDIPCETLVSAMQVDKKNQAGRLRFSLPVAIGDVRTGVSLQPHQIRSILDCSREKQR